MLRNCLFKCIIVVIAGTGCMVEVYRRGQSAPVIHSVSQYIYKKDGRRILSETVFWMSGSSNSISSFFCISVYILYLYSMFFEEPLLQEDQNFRNFHISYEFIRA